MNRNIVFAIILVILGFVCLIIFIVYPSFNDWSFVINPSLAGNLGSLSSGVVGSLFSLAGVILLYETIIRQQNIFQIQQFESKFFELLRYQRENRDKLPSYSSATTPILSNYFDAAVEDLEHLLKEDFAESVSQEEKIKIITVYIFCFYGVDKKDNTTTQLKKYGLNDAQIDTAFKNLAHLSGGGGSYYKKHYKFIDHYLRHLSQLIKFIDDCSFIDKKQKYEYIKLLRAQLTQSELKFIFYNEITRNYNNTSWENKYKWITKYSLFKNLPKVLDSGIEPKKHFNIKYDWES